MNLGDSATVCGLCHAAERRSVRQRGAVIPDRAFIANEARWVAPDAVLLVFVIDGAVVAARVNGQLTRPPARDPSDPESYVEPHKLLLYQGIEPRDPRFIDLDKRNFRLSSAELIEVRASRRRALWTGPLPNSGSITLIPRSGRRRRLILLGRQDLARVHALLVSAGFPMSRLAA